MWTSRHKNIRRRFAVTQLSKNRLDKQNHAALSERLGAGLRRKGCDAYLNGTRAFRETQRCPNEPLKAVKQSAPQRERGTEMLNTLCGLEPRARRSIGAKDLFNTPSLKIDRAACMWTSRHKNIRRRFTVGIFCRCSQLRRAYFAQGRTIDREGQYPLRS